MESSRREPKNTELERVSDNRVRDSLQSYRCGQKSPISVLWCGEVARGAEQIAWGCFKPRPSHRKTRDVPIVGARSVMEWVSPGNTLRGCWGLGQEPEGAGGVAGLGLS